jgi:DNA-binding transcriptional LysR family regulator
VSWTTFRQMEVFIEAVEAGSFRLCSDRLGISQPTVSLHIHKLEEQLGYDLFLRRRGAISGVTEPGGRFYSQAKLLMGQANALWRSSQSATRQRPRLGISIGAPPFITGTVLADMIVELAKEREDIEFTIVAQNYASLVDRINEGKLDIAYFFSNVPVPELDSIEIRREEGGFYVSVDHPLANQTDITPAALSKCSFIAPPAQSHIRSQMTATLRATGILEYAVTLATDDSTLLLNATKAGLGIGCLLKRSALPAVAEGTLVELTMDRQAIFLGIRQALAPRCRLDQGVRLIAERLARALQDRRQDPFGPASHSPN